MRIMKLTDFTYLFLIILLYLVKLILLVDFTLHVKMLTFIMILLINLSVKNLNIE